MAAVSPVRVVDIDLTSFRIPPPPFWRSRYAPAAGFFGLLFLSLGVMFAGGRDGAMLGFGLMALVILAAFLSIFWTLPRLIRDRSRSSVAGDRIPFARAEDLGRTPPGFDRPLGAIVDQVRAMEAGAPPPEILKRPVPPEVRRHALAYQVGAGLVGVGFLLYLAVFHRAGALDVMLFLLAATALLTRARRVMAQSADELISHDRRAPILFLRSFMDDKIRIKQWQRLFGLQNPLPIRFEEALADMIGRYGPFLAIGEPDEGLPQLGAARAYPGEGEWQQTVQRWIREARLIAMLCGPTRWVHWEVQNIVAAARLSRLLLFLPPGRGPAVQARRRRLDRWDNIVRSLEETPYGPAMRALNIDDVLLIQFGADRLNVFRSTGDMSQDYALAAALAASLAADAPAATAGGTAAEDAYDPEQTRPDWRSSAREAPKEPTRRETPPHHDGGRGTAPAELWLLLGGVGLAVGVLLLLAGRGGLAGRGVLGFIIPFLFAGGVAGGVALWGGHERGQWPRVLGALGGAVLLGFVINPLLIRMLMGLGFRGQGVGLLLFGLGTRLVPVGALALASSPFRATPAWVSGVIVAVVASVLALAGAAGPGPARLLLAVPPAMTAAWIGYVLARRTLA